MHKNETHIDPVLEAFMLEHFDFAGLKKAGLFPKGMKRTDYEGQAKIICKFFSYESIYEYGQKELRGHISYTNNKSTDTDIQEHRPFVETFFSKAPSAKVIPLKQKNENRS